VNLIWTLLIVASVAVALLGGDGAPERITVGLAKGASDAVTFAFGLIGVLAFWSGMLRVAEEAGVTRLIGRALAPLIARLFPDIPKDHPANASITMALAANILGLGNAATPLGLKAMEDLARLNRTPGVASNAMCTFLAMTTSSLTLIPATVIAVRTAAGSSNPAAIVGTTIAATLVSTIVAVVADRWFQRATGAR